MQRANYSSALFALALLASCSHKQEQPAETPPPATAPAPQPAAPPATNDASSSRSCTADTDCHDGELCSQSQCVAISGSMSECGLVRVHFGFNSSDIDPAERALLERSARCLHRDHKLHVVIEGNADERGTEEYNLALGDRRATAVSKYLEQLGASPTQLKAVSYGKEKPLCTEHDEACWAKNRRAAVQPTEATSSK